MSRRHIAITIIGWVYILGAVFTLLAGSLGFMTYANIQQMRKLLLPPGEFQDTAFLRFMVRYVLPVLVLQIPISLFVAITGAQFLKLKAWARTVLEVLAWILAAYIVVSGIFWLIIFLNFLFGHPAAPVAGDYPPLLKILFVGVSSLSTLVWIFPIGVGIFFLRHKDVKKEFH